MGLNVGRKKSWSSTTYSLKGPVATIGLIPSTSLGKWATFFGNCLGRLNAGKTKFSLFFDFPGQDENNWRAAGLEPCMLEPISFTFHTLTTMPSRLGGRGFKSRLRYIFLYPLRTKKMLSNLRVWNPTRHCAMEST